MKIAILHLSDFHIKEGDRFLIEKINGIISSLNILGTVDDYIIVFRAICHTLEKLMNSNSRDI